MVRAADGVSLSVIIAQGLGRGLGGGLLLMCRGMAALSVMNSEKKIQSLSVCGLLCTWMAKACCGRPSREVAYQYPAVEYIEGVILVLAAVRLPRCAGRCRRRVTSWVATNRVSGIWLGGPQMYEVGR